MTMRNISIDLNARKASGAGGVQGSVPTGTFQADRIKADLDARTVALEGNAHMRMVPGQMKMPQ
jgi:lipopolysaccharide export system protein LptC